MTAVKLSGTFAEEARLYNGLEAIAAELVDKNKMGTEYYAVCKVRAHASGWTYDKGGEDIPTAKVLHIEVVDGDRVLAVKEILDAEFHSRTGGAPKDTLPFDDGPVSERPKDEWLDDKAGD